MLIAVPTESLASERRVALIPDAAKKLVRAGIDVCIEQGAGLRSGFADADYEAVGATLSSDIFGGPLVTLILKRMAPEAIIHIRLGTTLERTLIR